jgi:ribose 5-phosphate isomerase B
MKIIIGSDHRGFVLKAEVMQAFQNYEWVDVGVYSKERSDYPIIAQQLCTRLLDGEAERGVLICGSGVGISMAANRFPGIYAANCWNEQIARLSREDDNANVLVLPADFISLGLAVKIIDAWLAASFKEGIYRRRLEMIDER